MLRASQMITGQSRIMQIRLKDNSKYKNNAAHLFCFKNLAYLAEIEK